VNQSAVGPTIFHLDTLGTRQICLPSVQKDNSVQTREVIASLSCLSEAHVNLIATVHEGLHQLACRLIFCFVQLDQCQGPTNFRELADASGRGLNFNGSVCLNNVCM